MMSLSPSSQSPRSVQADFGRLSFPSEHEEFTTENVADHPVLSRRGSSAKSDEEELPATHQDSGKNEDLQKILDELLSLMPASRTTNSQSEGTPMEYEFSQGHALASDVDTKPPRRFFRRFWRGITQRMMSRVEEHRSTAQHLQ